MATSDSLSLFGRRVRARRNAAEMSQEQLAAKIGRSRSSVANIEGGRQDPPLTLIEKIAAAFGITTGELLDSKPAPEMSGKTPPLVIDAAELYQRLDDRRLDQGLSWREVAYAAQVSASTLTRLGHGGMTDVTGLARLLAWLGDTDLAPYLMEKNRQGIGC